LFGLLPKDEAFFDLFDRMAGTVHEGALLLSAMLGDFTEVEEKAKQIRNVEHSGDHLTREAIEKLNRTFITPFEREEIHELVCRMDDILDSMENAANRLSLYRIDKPTPDAIALGKVLVNCTELLRQAVPMLRQIKKPQEMLNLCLAVHKEESEGDRIEQHGLAGLFERRQDPIEIIKWKDIYSDLEQATDRCADVANVIESIVLRHA